MRVLQELEDRAVELVSPVLGDHVDHAAQRPAILRIEVGGLHFELTHGIRRRNIRNRCRLQRLLIPSTRTSLVLGRPPLMTMLDEPANIERTQPLGRRILNYAGCRPGRGKWVAAH